MADYIKIIFEVMFDKIKSYAEITCDPEDIWFRAEITSDSVVVWSYDHVITIILIFNTKAE